MSGKYPNAFYRVSTKAVIENDRGEFLLVKEHEDSWDFPGGGMDHGESVEVSLKRELQEELGICDEIETDLIDVDTLYLENKEAWLMRLMVKVAIKDLKICPSTDVSEVGFIDINSLKDSSLPIEQSVYKFYKKHY